MSDSDCGSPLLCHNGACIDIYWDPCFCGQEDSRGLCSDAPDGGHGYMCCTTGVVATGEPIDEGCPEGYVSIGSCCDTCYTGSEFCNPP